MISGHLPFNFGLFKYGVRQSMTKGMPSILVQNITRCSWKSVESKSFAPPRFAFVQLNGISINVG